MKLEEVFKDEMRFITDEKIRNLIVDCNKLVPEYFWTCPASTTGKYHPKVSLGKFGLIRHTKLAVWWGIEINRCWSNEYLGRLNEIICALILHDIQKNGESLDKQGYPTLDNSTKVHGAILAGKIAEESSESIDRIITAIGGHMGIWTAEEFKQYKPENQKDLKTRILCYIVHLADYCASRKCDDKAIQLSKLEFNDYKKGE